MSRSGRLILYVGLLFSLAMSQASAQPAVSLTGTYRCIQGCATGFENRLAFVTQNGWDINMVTESGIPVRGSFDWFSPTRLYLESWASGAVYSADGAIIQFDQGTIWQRVDPAAYCLQRYRSYDSSSGTYLGRDGLRHPCP